MELARTSWSFDWTYPDAIQHGPDDADHGLASNTIFEQLAFWTTPTNGGFEFRDTPYLRHADQSLAQEIRPGTKLRKHPIVYRSFAMFPPVAAAASDWVIDFEMENPYGITVQDVVDGLLTVYVHAAGSSPFVTASKPSIGWTNKSPCAIFVCFWT